jgi:hypothetical protein
VYNSSPSHAACQHHSLRPPLVRGAAAVIVAVDSMDVQPPPWAPARMERPWMSQSQLLPPQPAETFPCHPRHLRLKLQHCLPKEFGGGATRWSCSRVRMRRTIFSSPLYPARPLHHRFRRLLPLVLARLSPPRFSCCRLRR